MALVLGVVVAAVASTSGTREQPADPVDVPDDPAGPPDALDPAPAPAATTSPADDLQDIAFARRARSELRTLPAEWPIVRGVYSTMHSFWGQRWESMIELVTTTEINAIVIDVKDDKGQLAWDMDAPLAKQGGGGTWKPNADPRSRLRHLRAVGGYPIARIVCFKDSRVALARPDLAVVDVRTGEPWQGSDGQHWLNPYNAEAWQWCIDAGKEAARMGFLEVQFDYVRFPNGGDGPSNHFDFPGRPADLPRERWRHPDQITAFLTSAVEQLHAEGVRVSADIFGLTTYNWSWDGDGTGQVFERLAEVLDYVSPMVYPSHYGPGNYGLRPHPVDFPYETVWNAMSEAQMRSQGLTGRIRPWIEDFAPTWLGRGHNPQRVRDQKRAVYENGIEGWLLWNASNRFSVEALEAETLPRAEGDYLPPARTRDPDLAPGAEARAWPGRDPDATTESQHIGQGNSAGTSPGGPTGGIEESADAA